VLKNRDVRASQFRDISKIKRENYATNMQEFNSADEIYYFMDNMFSEGFDEKHIQIALDVFLRDFSQFEEKDLEQDTFKRFVRELGINLVTFKDEESFVKAAKFMDWYCIDDSTLWVNLETYLIKKEVMFSPKALITILSHFASQTEGSRDVYDFYEYLYRSKTFENCTTNELITIIYSFYQVHSGTVAFAQIVADDLIEKIDDTTTTYDLLRVVQAYSEISKNYAQLYLKIES